MFGRRPVQGQPAYWISRGAVLVLLSLPLAGCFADQKQQLAACKLEAIKLYPNEQQQYSAKVGDFLKACMGAHGYEYDAFQKMCGSSVGIPTPVDLYCYVPTSWVGWLVYRLETGISH
jgi:hypothetical protein